MKHAMLVLSVGMGLIAPSVQAQDVRSEFQVVVNADCEISEISRRELSRIFQKRVRWLPCGRRAEPVDLRKGKGVRDAFSRAVHGRSANQIESFWQRQIFSGRELPPIRKRTDAEVVAWVKANVGAIGYVATNVYVGGVRVVAVRD